MREQEALSVTEWKERELAKNQKDHNETDMSNRISGEIVFLSPFMFLLKINK